MSCKHTTILTTGPRVGFVQSWGENGRDGCDPGVVNPHICGAVVDAVHRSYWVEGREMTEHGKQHGGRAVTVAGLVAGGAGIAVLWASGVEFPIAIPPGLVILLAGALFVGLAPWRWATGVGAFMGLFVTCGFLISGGIPNLVGADGDTFFGSPNPIEHDTFGTVVGTWVQMIGVLTALITSAIATRNHRKPITRSWR